MREVEPTRNALYEGSLKIRSVYPYGTSCVFGLNMRKRNTRVSTRTNRHEALDVYTLGLVAFPNFKYEPL